MHELLCRRNANHASTWVAPTDLLVSPVNKHRCLSTADRNSAHAYPPTSATPRTRASRYNSANRDEAVFENPHTFDVARTPNEHVGFGGPGPHFCLGANLARREIKVMFERIFRRLPDLEITGPPERLMSNFIHGIKRMPCAFTPGRPGA